MIQKNSTIETFYSTSLIKRGHMGEEIKNVEENTDLNFHEVGLIHSYSPCKITR